jgi:hypothetical protein
MPTARQCFPAWMTCCTFNDTAFCRSSNKDQGHRYSKCSLWPSIHWWQWYSGLSSPKIFSEFHLFIFWPSLMLIVQVLVWRWHTSCDVFHDNPETYHTVIWLFTLYISFNVCSPYTLCTLYRQCEPFCWNLMSLYLGNNFTMTLCVAQTSGVSFSFWISSVLPVTQLLL